MADIAITVTANATAEPKQYVFTVNATNCTVSAADGEGSPIDLTQPIPESHAAFDIIAYPTSGYEFATMPSLTDGTNTLNFTKYGTKNAKVTFNPASPWA